MTEDAKFVIGLALPVMVFAVALWLFAIESQKEELTRLGCQAQQLRLELDRMQRFLWLYSLRELATILFLIATAALAYVFVT